MAENGKTFSCVNRSCNRRQEEIARVRRFLLINGFAEEADPARTDLVFFFTCAFCQSAVADMVKEIERLQSHLKAGGELIVGSCLPKTDGAALRKVFGGRAITPTDLSPLNELPGVAMRIEEMAKASAEEPAAPPRAARPPAGPVKRRVKAAAHGAAVSLMRAWPRARLERIAARLDAGPRMEVCISSGCARKCSYCAIRFATGRLRSKPLEVVTRMIADGWERGYRKFELLADSIGDYGLDIGTDLGELVEWLSREERALSVGLYDLHPQAFSKHFERILALSRAGRVHFLYVPLQSGNARILGLMNRACDVDDLREKLVEVRKLGGVFLQTSIIVGFPSETEEEFEDTVRFLSAVRFSDMLVHFYTDMPGTESSKLPEKIDKARMLRRLDRLRKAGIRYDREKARREWAATPPLG